MPDRLSMVGLVYFWLLQRTTGLPNVQATPYVESKITDETFQIREVPDAKKQFGSSMTDDYIVTAVYDPSVKYRLVEEYGPDSFTEQADGKLFTTWGFTTPQAAVEWFLRFGNRVKVLAPPDMVALMKSTLDSIKNLYET